MRAALVLVLLVGCAKKSAEPGARDTSAVSAPAAEAPASPPPPPKQVEENHQAVMAAKSGGGAPGGGAGSSAGSAGSAVDQARSSGVLGPTDQQAFLVKGTVSIGRASTTALAAATKKALDKLQACYDKALEMQESLAGELTISVSGGKPTVTKTTLKHAELEQCVIGALAAASLPAGKSTLVLAFKRG